MPGSNAVSHAVSIEIAGVKCMLTLPSDAVRYITSSGGTWRGHVALQPVVDVPTPAPVVTTRMAAIQKELGQKGRHNNVLRATVPERQVVRAWNRSKYIKALELKSKDQREPRNNPVSFKEIPQVLVIVRLALRTMGVTEILRHMETYFDFCSTGEHIWEGKSHGFKSLQGFLEKLLLLNKTKEKPWWDTRATAIRAVNDVNARLTIRIANSFAQTYMNEQKYPLVEGSKDHANFAKAAERMVSFITRKKRQGIVLAQGDVIKYLLEFVETFFANHGDPVYSAHLSSESVWSALPAFLSEKGVI